MHGVRRVALAVVTAAMLTLAVSACSSSSRMAEPVGSEISEAAAPCFPTAVNCQTTDDQVIDASDDKVQGVLDTRLQIINNTGWPHYVKLGAGCVDPYALLPQFLASSDSMSAVGWCGAAQSDVFGGFGPGDPLFGFKWINFYAGNPKLGYPWIEVDGVRHNFAATEECVFRSNGQVFVGYRGVDLSAAKDLRLTWVDETTWTNPKNLGNC